MPGRFQYEGALEKTPLAEVLITILRHRVPGRLDVIREDVEKQIWIRDGLVIAAASSDRSDRLGAWLYRQGMVTRDQLELVAKDREETGNKVGQILIDREIVTPLALHEALREQMIAIVESVFRWPSGIARFELGGASEPGKIRLHMPIPRLLLAGLREVPDLESREYVLRLGKKSTVFRPCWSTEDLVGLGLDREEYALLRCVDGRRTLREICAEGPWGMAQNARLLYGLRLLGLVEPVESGSRAVMIRMDADRSPDPKD